MQRNQASADKKKVLVTTALPESLFGYENAELVLLGEWCLDFAAQETWKNLDYSVLPYHWDDRRKMYEDYKKFKILYESSLKELASKLNEIHKTDLSLKSWRIILGPWLADFIQAVFDRYESLLTAFEGDCRYELRAVRHDAISSVPNDMVHFHQLFASDDWNERIYTELINLRWSARVDIVWVQKAGARFLAAKKKSLRNFLKENVLSRMSAVFAGAGDVFFIDSYMPRKFEILLQLKLGQMPAVWKSCNAPTVKPEESQRKWTLPETSGGELQNILRKMLPNHIPTAYLEGFSSLNAKSELLRWPKRPDAIFTSNSFSGDDVFKVWAAKRVEESSRLIIGQHGGHFGTGLFAFHEEHQIKIADSYISWGWRDHKQKHIVAIGNIKCFGSSVSHDPQGHALIVQNTGPRYGYQIMAMPIASQLLQYFEDQKIFLSELSSEVRSQIIVRLGKKDWGWRWAERWRSAMPEVTLDTGKGDIKTLVKGCRLFISTYNATTFLESLSWNIPTLMFWNENHWELNSQAAPYFQLLNEAGIFHPTPKSAARKTCQIWGDVDSWWYSDAVQKARDVFISQYARMPKDPLTEMQQALRVDSPLQGKQ